MFSRTCLLPNLPNTQHHDLHRENRLLSCFLIGGQKKLEYCVFERVTSFCEKGPHGRYVTSVSHASRVYIVSLPSLSHYADPAGH